MNKESKLDIIENKNRNLKLFKVFDLFVRCVLTSVGSVSLTSMLIFLNSRYGVSYFNCLIMTFIIPSLYSIIINTSLEGIDNKIKKMELEIRELENELDKNDELVKESIIKKIELRFEGLSSDNKKKLLNYVKDNCCEYVIKLQESDIISLFDIEDDKKNEEISSYVRSKKK